ncbi:hypothetical protein J6524_15120 [Bradyrhizobium sp. WSM 1738]|nr:hypothetical protein [Bradyrhizobium hereditatis]
MLFAIELIASFLLCGHRLIFTLDDPYIHLAVADQILAGGYGVNAGEFSSPSSSIIWPYLMALTEALHLGAYGPLLVSAAAAAATIFAVLRLLGSLDLFDAGRELHLPAVMALLVIPATSALALPMTGLEHSLHVWASVVTLIGLIEVARGRAPTSGHLVALVMLPLIRFEGAAFALAALAGFALLGRWRFAAAGGALITAVLALYAASMMARGLPLLPSSVLLKSRIIGQAYDQHSVLLTILDNFTASLANPYGQRLIVLGLAICAGAVWLRSDHRTLVVCGAVLTAIAAHLGFGQYDWFHRYEVYVIALASVTLLWIVAQLLPRLTAGVRNAAAVVTVALVGFASLPYLWAALVTPFASRGIYEQQEQMGRFAREFFPHPVAVNDLGLVAWRNPNFVLDLWGLGSEAVRKAKLAGAYGPAQMAWLAEARGVKLAMVYDRWFPSGVPASWTKVAVLRTKPVTAAVGDVAFYRTSAADQGELARALDSFAAQLPPRVTLERTPQ